MTHRFNKLLRSLPVLAGGGLLFFLPIGLSAQVDKFNFNYFGPDTVAANANCSRTLANAISPLPTVTSTVGATITMSMQDPAETTGGYAFNAPISAPNTVTVGWLVKDNQGHTAHFYFPITILDFTPPVFDLTGYPGALTYASVVQVPPAVHPPVSDNCTTSSQISVVLTETPRPDTCLAGSFTRTWKATDLAGNTAVITQTVNINADNAPPTFSSPPQSGSSPCAQAATAYPNWLAMQMTNFVVSDESGIRSITNNGPAAFPPGCAMPLTVTFQATDNCGLVLTRTATFSTSDTDPPVVAVKPRDTVGYCGPGNAHLVALNRWISQHGYQQSSDACSPASGLTYYMRIAGVPRDSAQVVAAFTTSLSGMCKTQTVGSDTFDQVRGKVTVDFLVRDVCGRESYAGVATFAAVDTLPPVITGTDKTEACGQSNNQALLNAWIDAHGNATATDDCSSVTWTNFSFVTSAGQTGNGSFGSGPYPTVVANDCHWYADVIFRATDQCGNIGADTLRFHTGDATPPVISGFTPVTTVYCPNTAPVNPTATVADNCDLSPTLVRGAPTTTLLNCSGNYDVRFIWTATDDCGNTSSAVQTFQVRDTSGPVFTLVPAPKTFRCDTFVLPPPVVAGVNIAADDECSVVQPNITTQIVSTQNADPAVCGHYSYQITRIFTATDDCGNTRTATQVLTIVDNLGPVPAGTLDTTVVCEVTPGVSPPKALDACSGATAPPVFLNQDITPGNCTDNYLVTLHWRAQDVCGTPTFFNQTIHVRDTMPPVLTGIPADISAPCNAIPDPPAVSSFTTTDNCDQSVTVTLTETETRDPNLNNCAHWTDYLLHRTWTAMDNCGNTTARTQTIHVQDNTPPVLVLPDTLQLANDPGDCGVALTIPAPVSVFDDCTSLRSNITLRDTAALVSTGGGPITTTPVDTLVFQWTAPNVPPASPVVGNATLTIFLDNADSEVASERFNILAEDDQSLGFTLPTPSQCGSGSTVLTIPADQLNIWLSDGLLTLRLAPLGTGGNAANAICPGGRARATLTYQAAMPQVPVTVTYRLDNNPALNYPPSGPQFLATGDHTILYTATDCAGNSSTAVLSLHVQDTEAPVVHAPAPLTAYVGQNNCQATVTLPFPTITDNCTVAGRFSRTSTLVNVAFQNDPNAGIIPKITTMNLTGLIPNAVGIGKLTIRHKGDNAQNGEFFNIYDENNALLDATTLGEDAGQCTQFNESTFDIPAASINAWAGTNGNTFFKAFPNNNVLSFNDFISPCMLPLLANMTDGISQIQAVLMYNYARVDYEITKGGVTIQADTLKGNLTTVTLPPGMYTVKYRVRDNSGVLGMTTFPLTVRDTVKPKAFCLSKTIFSDPSGLVTYTLLPSEINNNSVDNCSGTNLSFTLSQTTFTCNQAPNNFPVTMTVTDTAGNSASCIALIRVETIVLHPYYTPVCEGGDLFLYADSALAPNNTIYTFMWTGPGGYVSNIQNPPKISNASNSNEGTYTVKITGITGCMATGSVTVDLLNLPTQPILNITPGPYCYGSNITLSTPSYSGQNVNYLWYEGNQANSVLLATTLASNYTIVQPSLGQHQYFVKVAGNGCTSSNSDIRSIQVYPKPTASVEQENIVVCEGRPFNLGTAVMGNNLQYLWMGPNGFTSTLQYPPAIIASLATAGQYKLIITSNGCASEPAYVMVSMKAKPVKPQIVANSKVCEGATVTLLSGNYTGNTTYVWTSPQLDTTITHINTLSLPNVMVADSGYWFLIVEAQGCTSDPSAPVLVQVQAYPDVAAPGDIKICAGQPLQLSATANVADSLLWCWTGPNHFLKYERNPFLPVGVAGQYKVVGKTSFGCADSAFVNVSLSPAPVIDAVTNNAPVCASCNSDAVLQATISGQYGPLTYQWTFPNGFISPLASPVIPSVCVDDNGTYILVVRDSLNCPSLPKSTVVKVQKKPNTPAVNPVAAACQGSSVTLQVTNPEDYVGNYVRYVWTSQLTGLAVTTEQPSRVIGPLSNQNIGNYTVYVIVDSCQSALSANILVQLKPVPSAPHIMASPNRTLCEGETLQLFADPPSGNSYDWIRVPAGFSDPNHSANPSISNVSLADTGKYQVRVTVDGCTSGYSEPLTIRVNPRPAKPFLLPIERICLDDGTAKLKLSVLPGTPGAKYQFFNADLGTALGPPDTQLTFQTSDLSGLSPGINTFYVIAVLDSCSSLSSDPKTVQVDTIPDITAYAGADFAACASQPLLLNAADPGDGTWTQVSGPTTVIVNPNNDSTLVTGATAGNVYRYKWTLSNGACKNYSMDTVQVTAVAVEQAMATPLVRACENTVQLSAKPAITTTGTWTQSPNQATIGGIVIDEPGNPNTLVRNLQPGQTYLFDWNLGDTGCGPTSAQTMVLSLSNKPDIGADRAVCSADACATLVPNTTLPSGETGRWSSKNPAITFSNPTSAQGSESTSVCNLLTGPNEIYWITNDTFCLSESIDTVIVHFGRFPTANPDSLSVAAGELVPIDVLANDLKPANFSIEIITRPMFGNFDSTGLGQYQYQPNPAFVGTDQFMYKICNTVCTEEACSIATAKFFVQDATECRHPTLITPNGDGVNDVLFFSCIYEGEGGGENNSELTVFNQWGNEVFHAQPYKNNWEGTYNGEDLPPGTYYYILKSGYLAKPVSHFLIIQR